MKYILNNYDFLWKPMYLKCFNSLKNHKRVKNYPKTQRHEDYSMYYSSWRVTNECVLTGMCYDDNFLKPIYDFLEKPDNTPFKELIEACFHELHKTIEEEIEFLSSEEAIAEHFEANDYEFYEDGTRF